MGYGKGHPGRPRGTTAYQYRSEEEDATCVGLIEQNLTNEEVAARMEWTPEMVRDVRSRYFPTTGLAGAILRAGAARLATRVVEEATVEEALDVLTRTNIGVLKPIEKGGPRTGFFTSVQLDSLGGVRVSTALVEGAGEISTRPTDTVASAALPLALSPVLAGELARVEQEKADIRAAHPELTTTFDAIERAVDAAAVRTRTRTARVVAPARARARTARQTRTAGKGRTR